MKKQLFYCLIFVYFYSCSPPKPYYQRINYIPTKGPNFGVEMLFLEKPPVKPYFEVIDFDIVEKGKLSKWEIMKKLEMEAIKEGVDAVMEVDFWSGSEERVNFLTVLIDVLDQDEETTVINAPFTYIKGVGIKYLENIDYVQDQPEFEYVYQIDEQTGFPKPLFKIELNLTGQEHMIYPESEDAREIYAEYFQYFSDFHLLYQRERWSHKSVNNQVKKRILVDIDGHYVKSCKLHYDEQNRLSNVEIRNKRKDVDWVTYHYDEHGAKSSKSIVAGDGTRIFEQYHYDGGKLTGREISIIPADRGPYLLNTTILYFDPDYLQKFYEQEYAKQE
jgi:hypothetical protein